MTTCTCCGAEETHVSRNVEVSETEYGIYASGTPIGDPYKDEIDVGSEFCTNPACERSQAVTEQQIAEIKARTDTGEDLDKRSRMLLERTERMIDEQAANLNDGSATSEQNPEAYRMGLESWERRVANPIEDVSDRIDHTGPGDAMIERVDGMRETVEQESVQAERERDQHRAGESKKPVANAVSEEQRAPTEQTSDPMFCQCCGDRKEAIDRTVETHESDIKLGVPFGAAVTVTDAKDIVTEYYCTNPACERSQQVVKHEAEQLRRKLNSERDEGLDKEFDRRVERLEAITESHEAKMNGGEVWLGSEATEGPGFRRDIDKMSKSEAESWLSVQSYEDISESLLELEQEMTDLRGEQSVYMNEERAEDVEELSERAARVANSREQVRRQLNEQGRNVDEEGTSELTVDDEMAGEQFCPCCDRPKERIEGRRWEVNGCELQLPDRSRPAPSAAISRAEREEVDADYACTNPVCSEAQRGVERFLAEMERASNEGAEVVAYRNANRADEVVDRMRRELDAENSTTPDPDRAPDWERVESSIEGTQIPEWRSSALFGSGRILNKVEERFGQERGVVDGLQSKLDEIDDRLDGEREENEDEYEEQEEREEDEDEYEEQKEREENEDEYEEQEERGEDEYEYEEQMIEPPRYADEGEDENHESGINHR